jgi:secondary thiamine-phosphate synthase enzyme
MDIILKEFTIQTKPDDIINISKFVQDLLNESKLKEGNVLVFIAGSTAAISTVEYEPGLVEKDIPEFLEKIIPYNKDYAHHNTWGDHNGAGHLRSFLLKCDMSIPFSNGILILGTWQQVIFLELDEKPRRRTIYCQFVGK